MKFNKLLSAATGKEILFWAVLVPTLETLTRFGVIKLLNKLDSAKTEKKTKIENNNQEKLPNGD